MDFKKINEETYDAISENWDTKRSFYWRPVVDFVSKFVEGFSDVSSLRFLDLGCGGGRHLELAVSEGISKENCFGLDISSGQLEVVKSKGFDVLKSDFLNIPIVDADFDCMVCIAAHHHLLDSESQLEALCEFRRILKKGGRLLLCNWFPEEEFVSKQIEKGKFNFDLDSVQKVRVLYYLDGEQFDRFYYLFEEKELVDLCVKAGFEVEKKEYFEGNLYLTLG